MIVFDWVFHELSPSNRLWGTRSQLTGTSTMFWERTLTILWWPSSDGSIPTTKWRRIPTPVRSSSCTTSECPLVIRRFARMQFIPSVDASLRCRAGTPSTLQRSWWPWYFRRLRRVPKPLPVSLLVRVSTPHDRFEMRCTISVNVGLIK